MTRRQRRRRWSFVGRAWVMGFGCDTLFSVAPYNGAWCIEVWVGANLAIFRHCTSRCEAFKIAQSIRRLWLAEDKVARCKK